jgi:hypothetical protein
MPPPGFNSTDYGNSNGNWSTPQWNNNGGYDQDWLALPLEPLLDQWGADVNQTAMGPDIGGMDMLDLLLNMGGPPGAG